MNSIKKNTYTNPLTNGTGKLVVNSLKPCNLDNFTKQDVKDYFNNSYDLYETLFTSLKYDSVYYLCPDRLRLPLIFYYGHTAAVYINKLVLSGLVKPEERIDLELETTFETGVDEMSWDDVENYRMGGNYRWPSVQQVQEFRLKVRELINKVIDRTPLELPVNWDNVWWALFMGFEHDRIHYETSTVLIRQYPIDMVTKPKNWIYGPTKLNKSTIPIGNQMIKVPETQVRLGKSFDFPSYGWDNEYGQVDCKVSAFEASKYKVTNEQFLEFVINGGYESREFWSDEGWEWVQFKQAKHPLFWVCPNGCKSGCGGAISSYSHCQKRHFTDEELRFFSSSSDACEMKTLSQLDENGNERQTDFGYKLRVMFDIIQMPYNWPVEVNYHEAKAFCKWKGDDFRVLSEAEHHAIRDPEVFNLDASSDIIFQVNAKVNHNMAFGSSTPVDLYPSNSKGFNDVFGNVWEWCEDNFNALPGSKTHFLYDDFSSPCYDGRHNMIMGGSWVSTGDEASRFARFMFRRHFYQHCGFRLARSLPTPDGSRPNPQIRLVADRIHLLGGGTPLNPPNLDESKIQLNYYKTENIQYLHDSHLHPEYLEDELDFEYGGEQDDNFIKFQTMLGDLLKEHNFQPNLATLLGVSTGKNVFELTKMFNEVVAIDFCGKFLDVCIQLQNKGSLNYELITKNNKVVNLNQKNNLTTSKAIFKQMTWIPNEVPKSDFVLFTMIDRVMNDLSWLKRLREIVKSNCLLVIHSRQSKHSRCNLEGVLEKDFEFVKENSIFAGDTITVWKKN